MTDRFCSNPACRCKLSRSNPGDKCRPCLGREAGLSEDDYPPRPPTNGDAQIADVLGRPDMHVTDASKAGVKIPRKGTLGKKLWEKAEALCPPLTRGQSAVARLHLLDGHTLKATGALLGITKGAAKERWRRVLSRLGLQITVPPAV